MLLKIPKNVQEDPEECSRRFREMLLKILGNVPEDSGECLRRFREMFQEIPWNVIKDSGECSRRFQGMFKKMPGNIPEGSGECPERFRGMFKKIPGNLSFDLFLEISLVFLWNFAVTMLRNNGKKSNYLAILLKKSFSSLRLITSLLSSITIFLN